MRTTEGRFDDVAQAWKFFTDQKVVCRVQVIQDGVFATHECSSTQDFARMVGKINKNNPLTIIVHAFQSRVLAS